MKPEIIAGDNFGRNGCDCYISTTVALIAIGYWYVLLVMESVRGWCDDDKAQIKWTGSDKEEGLKQYKYLVKEINR